MNDTNVLGPGGLAKGPNNDFALTDAAWYKVQVYVEQGAALPKTMDEMQLWVGADNTITDEVKPDFETLVNAFSKIADQCLGWQNKTYPATVGVANHIVEYNQQVPDLYSALEDTLGSFQTAVANQDAAAIASSQQDFHDLLADRTQSARDFAAQADAAAASIVEFVKLTESDQTQLHSVQERFDSTYGSESAQVKALAAEVAAAQATLYSATEEFAEDCIIAYTSPAYAWVPFVGLIAAAVVTGVYIKRAADAAERIATARKTIAKAGGEIARDQNLLQTVNFARLSIDGVVDHMNSALPIIEEIKNSWNSIADGLDELSQMLKADTTRAIEEFQKIDFKTAVDDWQAIANKANTFRANAYITVQGGATAA